ncbi:trypsin-like peptidase domain-containing protein [Streptomyces piniterrae]|uniref:trypsin-like peptidase domain-containing protein n=1 Tax=Streptomyces piniterrae TaxID=2571125 RepID=UPI00145F2898|nr:trypsin-like peptidase domain-containing protein [Streptomyces piniterrae]
MGSKAEKPPWQVRLRTERGVAGGGILCANGTVLTCAHVVEQGRGPDGRCGVRVDFPFLERGSDIPARIVLAGEPAPVGGPDDVAVLRPDRIPYGAEPAPLEEHADLAGHTLGAYGFPEGHPEGVWAGGRLVGRTAAGLLQFAAVNATGHPTARGFSGSPVWDEDLQAVIGMVTAVDRLAEARTAYALPVDGLRTHWPELAEPCPVRLWIRDPHGGPPRMVPLRVTGPDRREFWIGRGDGGPREPAILLASRPRHVVSRWHCRLVCEYGNWSVESPKRDALTYVRYPGDDRLLLVPAPGRLPLCHGDTLVIRASLSVSEQQKDSGYWELEFVDDHHTFR